ncbi:hypothetical protein HNR77_002700 [Paenibacillus sp. JGP012]|nr:hypothetical protein [Paenibacillus sp. JGP012]
MKVISLKLSCTTSRTRELNTWHSEVRVTPVVAANDSQKPYSVQIGSFENVTIRRNAISMEVVQKWRKWHHFDKIASCEIVRISGWSNSCK